MKEANAIIHSRKESNEAAANEIDLSFRRENILSVLVYFALMGLWVCVYPLNIVGFLSLPLSYSQNIHGVELWERKKNRFLREKKKLRNKAKNLDEKIPFFY